MAEACIVGMALLLRNVANVLQRKPEHPKEVVEAVGGKRPKPVPPAFVEMALRYLDARFPVKKIPSRN
jgi:hypothetical protein